MFRHISVQTAIFVFLAGTANAYATKAIAQVVEITDDNAYELIVRSTKFRLPYLYLERRPLRHELHKLHEWTNHFDFAFWMPDGRPLAGNPMSTIGYRPREDGRDPTADSYVIHVRKALPVLISDSSYVNPEKQFSNLNRVMHLTDQSVFRSDSKFGLQEYEPKNPDRARFYVSHTGEKPQVLISCPPHPKKRPFPSCVESVFYEDEGIGLTIQLPLLALSQWKQVADKALELVRSWRVSST